LGIKALPPAGLQSSPENINQFNKEKLMAEITVTKEKLKSLKSEYDTAVKDKKESFNL
jgi:hypothetical protein